MIQPRLRELIVIKGFSEYILSRLDTLKTMELHKEELASIPSGLEIRGQGGGD